SADVSAEEQRQQNEDQHIREAVKDVDNPHHEMIEIPSFEAGRQAISSPDDKRNHGRTNSHGHGNPSTVKNSRQKVSSEPVGTNQVRPTRLFQNPGLLEAAGPVGRYPGRQEARSGYG